MKYLYNSFYDAKEYGSILDIENINYKKLFELISTLESNKNNLDKFKYQNEIQILKNILNQYIILSKNYDIVITNPPYMGNSGMNTNLKNYLKNKFPNSKSDLFAVFIEKCHEFSKSNGFIAMITQQSFMFLSTFEKLRVDLINTHTILNMAHLGAHAFEEIGGEVVQATSFINRNNFIKNYNSTFHRLIKFNSESKKEQEFHNDKNNYCIKQNKFDKIPGIPLAYWISDEVFDCYNEKLIEEYADVKKGLSTGDNNKYIRYWYEISINNIGLHLNEYNKNYKWYPINKGGSFRKWYGNNQFVVNWENNGSTLKNFKGSVIRNEKYYFKECLTWTMISSSKFGIRFSPQGFIFEGAGPCLFAEPENLRYILGFLCSNVAEYILNILNPTMNINIENIKKLPIGKIESKNYLLKLINENITISKENWDSYEISYDFKKHPLLSKQNLIKDSFKDWANVKKRNEIKLRNNEIKINEYFIQKFNLIDIVKSNPSNTLISLNYDEEIRTFVSYAVGCMFGRYSLDQEGLQHAGGEFNLNNYSKFVPDDDNIIPVLDTAYFDDDIVGRFIEFVKTCFGEESLEENLDFIANALAKNKKPSREKIRDYLVKNFFNDHKKIYKKCPIYWQFSSGKENGFNCLVYMHRYEPSLVARVRTDYLHKTQKAIEQAISNCDNIIDNSSSNTEIARATKDKTKLQKQLQETQEYDEALAHIANQNIEIDLDDGVKVNYAKFQNVEVSREGKKTKKVNLLKKL